MPAQDRPRTAQDGRSGAEWGPRTQDDGRVRLGGSGAAWDDVRRANLARPTGDPDWTTLLRNYPPPTGRCVGCGSLPSHPVHGELERRRVLVTFGGDDVEVDVDVCRFCRGREVPRVREWAQLKRRGLIARGLL